MADFPESAMMKKNVADVMTRGMELVDLFVNKNYLIDIDQCSPIPLDDEEQTFSAMSLFKIDKIVYDLNENINDKLVSVYSALSNYGSSAILVISSDETGVSFYLGTRDTNRPDVAKAILKKSLRGNFPGINIYEKNASQIEAFLLDKIPEVYSHKTVTAVSIVPGMRDEEDKDHFVQGIEKFIDSMAGENYTAVFVSSPLSKQDLEDKKRGYEELYSALSQCSQIVITYGENESDSVAEGISSGFSKSINDGISNTTGKNSGTNRSKGRSKNHGFSFGLFGTGFNMGSGTNTSRGSYEGTNESHTENYSETETTSDTKTSTQTKTQGTTASIQLTRHNKTVEELLEKIDKQLERIKNCESYGLWDSACYFIADKEEVAIVAANTFKALVAGEKTSVENSFINIWDGKYEHYKKSLQIMDYLRYGMHPKFTYKASSSETEYDSQEVTAASLISGVELPLLMGLPHKSVSGVTSIEAAEFGRNVFHKGEDKSDRAVNLGAIYHMGEVFKNNRVKLNLETLTSHCFITGSTGSGKSNTTSKLIDELIKPENNVKFLIIEPAKGEYKIDFGGMPGINIFTSNPKYYSMFCINPFEFDEEIHVLEHLDRLIEIFSACWPLYAAMPAILKSSFERAYIMHGWDLNHSTHQDMGNGKFPSFKDIVNILPVILNESEFSAETKGNYVGSLVTRVESLTNGLVGQMFNGVPISDEVLFNENTIVDLSRVGSTETKALIMGLLVLKLSEFRQATSNGTNLPLHHVTIMEEAHNLLKRTSTDQGQESANLQGKSVEMISNSIAEMRTYGEGFIIVDQSPTAVDISAIKNTNTKIVMRLPEALDCEAIGHSIGLNDEQILELSKLDKGVAAIFQNDWLETVLTKIDRCSGAYKISAVVKNDKNAEKDVIFSLIEELINQSQDKKYNLGWLKDSLRSSKVTKSFQATLEKIVTDFYEEWRKGSKRNLLAEVIFKILNCSDLIKMNEPELPAGIKKSSMLTPEIRKQGNIWCDNIYKGLDVYANFLDKFIKDQVFMNIILYLIEVDKKSDQYKVALYCAKHKK
jgi:hypothetical protein